MSLVPPDYIESVLSLYNHSKQAFHGENFMNYSAKSPDVHKYEFKYNYEIWYYSDIDKISLYQGMTKIRDYMSASLYPDLIQYLTDLQSPTSSSTSENSSIIKNGFSYCGCRSPRIVNMLMITTSFKYCTECKLERL